MAAWMGVGQSEVAGVFPRLSLFSRPNLGFMRSAALAPEAGKIYRLFAKHSGMALSLETINTSNGTRVVQKSFNPNDRSQKWQLEATGDAFFIKNLASGLVLDVSGHINNEGLPVNISGNGQLVYQWAKHGGDNQRFRIEPVNREYFRLVVVHSGKVVDIAKALATEGAPTIQWPYQGGGNQLFNLEETNS